MRNKKLGLVKKLALPILLAGAMVLKTEAFLINARASRNYRIGATAIMVLLGLSGGYAIKREIDECQRYER